MTANWNWQNQPQQSIMMPEFAHEDIPELPLYPSPVLQHVAAWMGYLQAAVSCQNTYTFFATKGRTVKT